MLSTSCTPELPPWPEQATFKILSGFKAYKQKYPPNSELFCMGFGFLRQAFMYLQTDLKLTI